MFALHARYRGREIQRADYVQRFATALAATDGVEAFHILDVEDMCANVSSAAAVTNATMALLSAAEWSVGIGVIPHRREHLGSDSVEAAERVRKLATVAVGKLGKAGVVKARIDARGADPALYTADISGVFCMLGHVLSKRTLEGREATSLMRAGYNQNEAAQELGISKQAMSQRLQAAGWQAESAGWHLAVNLLQRAEEL